MSASIFGETDTNSMIYTDIVANDMKIISGYATNYPVIPCLTGSNLWAFKVYNIVTGQPIGAGVSVSIQYQYIN